MALNGVTTTSTPTQATDANFRAWGSHISTQLAAAGHVQTGDTGQINWTTVLCPAGANATQGYEIWRLDDSLHATAPVYIKIEWGSGSAATVPSMFFTFGTGTNGAGTLTGPISTRQQCSWAAYATNALSNYWSGDTSRFSVAMWANGTGVSTSMSAYFAWERTKDSAGADTNQGILATWKVTTGTGATAQQGIFWDRVLGTVHTPTKFHTLCPVGATMKNGTQIGVSPIFFFNGPALNPPLNVLVFANADIVAYGAVTFQMYGASRVYMPIPNTVYGGTSLSPDLSTPAMMVRYD